MQFIYRSCSLPICFCFYFSNFIRSLVCVCVFLEKISDFLSLVGCFDVVEWNKWTEDWTEEGNVVNLVCNSLIRSHRVRNEMSKNEQFLWPLNGVSFSLFWLHCVRDGGLSFCWGGWWLRKTMEKRKWFDYLRMHSRTIFRIWQFMALFYFLG